MKVEKKVKEFYDFNDVSREDIEVVVYGLKRALQASRPDDGNNARINEIADYLGDLVFLNKDKKDTQDNKVIMYGYDDKEIRDILNSELPFDGIMAPNDFLPEKFKTTHISAFTYGKQGQLGIRQWINGDTSGQVDADMHFNKGCVAILYSFLKYEGSYADGAKVHCGKMFRSVSGYWDADGLPSKDTNKYMQLKYFDDKTFSISKGNQTAILTVAEVICLYEFLEFHLH